MTLKIDPAAVATEALKPAGQADPKNNSNTLVSGLSDTFSRMLNEVNSLQLEADRKIEEFATSKEKDIHGTMIAMQKAEVSLRLLLQVRSKLTAAYQEVMRTNL